MRHAHAQRSLSRDRVRVHMPLLTASLPTPQPRPTKRPHFLSAWPQKGPLWTDGDGPTQNAPRTNTPSYGPSRLTGSPIHLQFSWLCDLGPDGKTSLHLRISECKRPVRWLHCWLTSNKSPYLPEPQFASGPRRA